jgi:hypothetical protein
VSTRSIVIPKPSEYRRWRWEYWHARTHDHNRREALAKAGRMLRAVRARHARLESQISGSHIAN